MSISFQIKFICVTWICCTSFSNSTIFPTPKIQDNHHDAVKVFSDCENCSNIFIISSIYSIHFGNIFQILRKKEIKLLLQLCLDLWGNALKPIAFTPKPNGIFELIRWTIPMDVAVVLCTIFSQNIQNVIPIRRHRSIQKVSLSVNGFYSINFVHLNKYLFGRKVFVAVGFFFFTRFRFLRNGNFYCCSLKSLSGNGFVFFSVHRNTLANELDLIEPSRIAFFMCKTLENILFSIILVFSLCFYALIASPSLTKALFVLVMRPMEHVFVVVVVDVVRKEYSWKLWEITSISFYLKAWISNTPPSFSAEKHIFSIYVFVALLTQ